MKIERVGKSHGIVTTGSSSGLMSRERSPGMNLTSLSLRSLEQGFLEQGSQSLRGNEEGLTELVLGGAEWDATEAP